MPAIERSANVDYLAHVTGKLSYKPGEPYNSGASCPAYNPSKCPGFSSLNFLRYENLGYDFMVANGTAGLSVWSLKDPAHPKFVSQVPVADLAARDPDTAAMSQFWEGENMTVDSRRKIAFMSRDALTRGFFAIDLKDPWHPAIIGFQKVFQGHTMTCLNDCRFLWSVGGVQSGPSPAKASAVSVTDVRDVEHPFTYSSPIAVGRQSPRLAGQHALGRRRLRRHRLGLRLGRRARLLDRGSAQGSGHGPEPLRDAVRTARRTPAARSPATSARSCTTPTTSRGRSATRPRVT